MKIVRSTLSVLFLIGAPAGALHAQESDAEAPAEAAAPSEDDMADQLNSQQQLQQTFTLKRTVNGEVVETKKKTVTLSPGDPYRPTEAGETTLQQVRSAFDNEVLSRVEAFEEAKLDFTIADADRDGRMTAQEFSALVKTWRQTGERDAAAASGDTDREREYQALLAAIDPEAANNYDETNASAKFAFISGAQGSIAREDYIREYLLDFDTMDVDNDTFLKGDELMRFRAANRGETVNDPAP